MWKYRELAVIVGSLVAVVVACSGGDGGEPCSTASDCSSKQCSPGGARCGGARDANECTSSADCVGGGTRPSPMTDAGAAASDGAADGGLDAAADASSDAADDVVDAGLDAAAQVDASSPPATSTGGMVCVRSCGAGRCVPACSPGGCGRFATCEQGMCIATPCADDSACPGGFCVNGTCNALPGRCLGTEAPP
ncbi:MAG: hypothetical protein JST00_00770 [Deltaproteobacteria bacterium]|nr:hypothetical protein [Deltaproteobacteria bacterium]